MFTTCENNTVCYVIRRDYLTQALCNTGIMVSAVYARVLPHSSPQCCSFFSWKVGDQQKLGHAGDPLSELFAPWISIHCAYLTRIDTPMSDGGGKNLESREENHDGKLR